MDSSTRYGAVLRLAQHLVAEGHTMNAELTAAYLNHNGITTAEGGKYVGGRGTYRMWSTAYDWAKLQGLEEGASAIAMAFVDADGGYAWRTKEPA